MPVYYNNEAIIPAPFASISKEYQTTEDGTIVGSVFLITLKGKFVSYKGSPNSKQVFWTTSGYPPDETFSSVDNNFTSILRKLEALRILFSQEGHTLQIQPFDGAPPIKCNPRIRRLEFPEGQWVFISDYVITLEADVLYMNGKAIDEDDGTDVVNYHISKASDDWSFEPVDDKFITYRLTRTVSATGKRFYDSTGVLTQEAWQNASDYVKNNYKLGIDNNRIAQSILVPISATGQAYNYARTEHVNKKGGIYSVTESWLVFDPGSGAAAVEEFTAVISVEESQRVTVNMEGTITGLRVSDNTSQSLITDKYTNAAAKLAQVLPVLFTRAQSYSGFNLNPTALRHQTNHAVIVGVITYTYTYDNRPTSLIPGSISEKLSFNFNNPNDVFAKIPVLGRAIGPVLQDIGTVTESTKGFTIEAILPAASVDNPAGVAKPNTDSIVVGNAPSASQVFKGQDSEDWNPYTGTYSRRVLWTYQ